MKAAISSNNEKKQELNLEEIMPYLKDEEKQIKKLFYTYPKDFDFKNKKSIQKFAERLTGIQKIRQEASKEFHKKKNSKKTEALFMEDIYKKRENWGWKDLAEALNVTPPAITKYSRGDLIPEDKLPGICTFFGVTAHYLLGLVNEIDKTLDLDNDGNIICDENGKPKELLHFGIEFTPISALQALHMYGNLYFENKPFFWLIANLMRLPKQKYEVCVKKLEQLLNGLS